MAAWDTVVIGGGLVGAALAYGLARAGVRVAVLDEGDLAFRASRGNFGLVWVQSKGDGMPDYAVWTRRSADIWPDLAAALAEETGIDTGYSKPGGLHFFFSEEEMEARRHLLARMHNLPGIADYGAKLIDRQEALELAPDIGPDVLGASWSPHDGHVNPLRLLRALHAGMAKRGAGYFAEHRVRRITPAGRGFTIETDGQTLSAGQVVLAAGLGNRALGPQVGLEVPVNPLKGQILVSERTTPFLTMPTHVIRQTDEGTVMMGDSHEDVGFETGSSSPVMAAIARHAIRTFPRLAGLRIIRAWAALRIMTPDGFPLYQESQAHPGAFSINCHSGVTLAGAHALALAPMLAAGRLGAPVAAFSGERLHAH